MARFNIDEAEPAWMRRQVAPANPLIPIEPEDGVFAVPTLAGQREARRRAAEGQRREYSYLIRSALRPLERLRERVLGKAND